jgi:hypothetical protein
MTTFYSPLGPAAEAAYAQVLDHAMMSSLQRSVADLSGTFAKKMVAGREYWYYQYRDVDKAVKQIYLGQRSERLDRLIDAKSSPLSERRESIAKQARAAIALGNAAMTRSHFRVIRCLEEYGFFKAGGVLIGTHAFACYGNMLGVAWGDANQSQEDFAYAGRSVSLALPTDVKLDVHDAITSLEMGFLPVSKLDGLAGGTYVIPHQPDFRLDFITTEGRKQKDLVNFPNLNVAMVPLKFMEYSLQDIRQVAMLSEEGAVLVNVPSPPRYALHKLIVAGERGGSFRTKVNKDLRQSASLLAFLAKYQPDDLMEAWDDLEGRGKGWQSRFNRGVEMLLREFPAIEESLLWRATGASNSS